jgi:hypothetical protein
MGLQERGIVITSYLSEYHVAAVNDQVVDRGVCEIKARRGNADRGETAVNDRGYMAAM